MNEFADKLVVRGGYVSLKDEPIELDHGKYYIPGFSRYYMTKDLRIFERGTSYQIPLKYKGNNYPMVDVYSDMRGYNTSVGMHRLVALTFLSIPEEHKDDKMEVDHINHNRTDYRVSNLEWVTKTENYIRGRQSSKPVSKISLVYDKKAGVSGVFNTYEKIVNYTGYSNDEMKTCFDNAFIYTDEKFVIRTLDTSTMTGHKTPVVVCDHVDGSSMIARSYSEAEYITTVRRGTMYDYILESMMPNRAYVKGYSFHRIGEEPEKVKKLSMGEAAYYTFIRTRLPFYGAASVGFIVHDKEKNIAYPYPNRAKLVKAISKSQYASRRYQIYQIYNTKTENITTTEYQQFNETFNGTYSLDTLKVFDIPAV